MNKYTFFYKTESPFSQWYKCKFIVNDINFNCAEQFMMYKKAHLFHDLEVADKILETKDQRKQKKLGRLVRNFDQTTWENEREGIVFEGNWEKFNQNTKLKKMLLNTSGTHLVEASPTDQIWGIGLSMTSPDRFDEKKWRGKNLLGKILTAIRDKMLKMNEDV